MNENSTTNLLDRAVRSGMSRGAAAEFLNLYGPSRLERCIEVAEWELEDMDVTYDTNGIPLNADMTSALESPDEIMGKAISRLKEVSDAPEATQTALVLTQDEWNKLEAICMAYIDSMQSNRYRDTLHVKQHVAVAERIIEANS
jgi:hypothetical protein